MGLLDDLLGQLTSAEPPPQQGIDRPNTRTAPTGGGMSPLLTALLPVVLSMLAGGRAQSAAAGAGTRGDPPAGGGLGDLLGSVLGGAAGTGGGLGALLERFQRAGFGEQAGSWVGTGANQPLPAAAMSEVFGRDAVAEIARRAGVSDEDASRGLAELLPEVVDRVTPNGDLPAGDKLSASVDALTRRLGLA
jgi:uncharacterized protein YidB (DUF937 family)